MSQVFLQILWQLGTIDEYFTQERTPAQRQWRHGKAPSIYEQSRKEIGNTWIASQGCQGCIVLWQTCIISVFDIKAMLLSVLADKTLMRSDNIARGYHLRTGFPCPGHPSNENYGQFYTGDAWHPELCRFIGQRPNHMPLVLIVFCDKTHTDLYRALSVTPVIFTLTLFNCNARMSRNLWQPLAYIWNIHHGKSKKGQVQIWGEGPRWTSVSLCSHRIPQGPHSIQEGNHSVYQWCPSERGCID